MNENRPSRRRDPLRKAMFIGAKPSLLKPTLSLMALSNQGAVQRSEASAPVSGSAPASVLAAIHEAVKQNSGAVPKKASIDRNREYIASNPPGPLSHTALPPPLASLQQDWSHPPHRTKPFVFISTFKWELRKGWDRLVEAYLAEFSSQDNVELYILTKNFMAGR